MATNTDFKALRATIKEKCDRDTAKELLEALGVAVGRDYRFNENNSFSIDKNGYIKDFGSTDFNGDIVSFMIDVLGSPPSEAMEWTAKSLGVWDE
ncbi:MAG: hypothetical protein PHV62_04780 [Sulfuricurvum sp.]|nr:hypothetical protein [Sulfuricurvum sp.]